MPDPVGPPQALQAPTSQVRGEFEHPPEQASVHPAGPPAARHAESAKPANIRFTPLGRVTPARSWS